MSALDVLAPLVGVGLLLAVFVRLGLQVEREREVAAQRRRLAEALTPIRQAMEAFAEVVATGFLPALVATAKAMDDFNTAWSEVADVVNRSVEAEVEQARHRIEYMSRGDDG